MWPSVFCPCRSRARFLFYDWKIHGYMIYYSLFNPFNQWMDIWIVSALHLWIVLIWTLVNKILCRCVSYFVGHILMSETAGSYDKSMFNFSRTCQIVFQSSCSVLYSYHQVWGFQLFGILINTWYCPPFFIIAIFSSVQSVQLLSHVRLFVTPWIAARQASLSITISQSLLDSRPSSPWCHQAISSSVVPFSSCPQYLPASESFQWVNSLHEVAKVLEFQL